MVQGIRVFCSYSHEDKQYLSDLKKHVTELERQKLISVWTDQEIIPGGQFEKEIAENLDSCDLFICLVSSSFLASRYCIEKELQKALDRHADGTIKILPIIVRPSDWLNSELKDLKAVPTDGKAISTWQNTDSAYLDVVSSVYVILQHLKSDLGARSPVSIEVDKPTEYQFKLKTLGALARTVVSAIQLLEFEIESLGYKVQFHTDFSQFNSIKQLARGYPTGAEFSLRNNKLNCRNAFWASLTELDSPSTFVGLQAFRVDNIRPNLRVWAAQNIPKQHREYGDVVELRSGADIESMSSSLKGNLVYHGELWLGRQVKAKSAFETFGNLGLLEAKLRFSPKAIWALTSHQMARHGHIQRLGYVHLEQNFLNWKSHSSPEVDKSECLAITTDKDLNRIARMIVENADLAGSTSPQPFQSF